MKSNCGPWNEFELRSSTIKRKILESPVCGKMKEGEEEEKINE